MRFTTGQIRALHDLLRHKESDGDYWLFRASPDEAELDTQSLVTEIVLLIEGWE